MALSPAAPADVGVPFAIACLLIVAITLLIAAIGDMRTRIIPNPLCITVAALALAFWAAASPEPVTRIAIQVGILFAAAPVLLLLFARDMMGGGDIKLIAALLLWLAPRQLVDAFMVMAIAGGAVALVMLLVARNRTAPPSVPYGVAIAIGALGPLHEHLDLLLHR